MATICKFDNCTNKHDSHGFCANHARQYRKYGHPLSAEEKSQHISQAMLGNKRTLGKTWTIKDTAKMKGKHPKSEFKKGNIPTHIFKGWMSEKHAEAIRKASTGRIPWNKGTTGLMPRPHNKIGDGITEQDKLERKKFYKTVHAEILRRDDYTCQICDVRGGNLQVDHIKSWARFPELRFVIDNCRTLCMSCHYYVTFKRKIPVGVIWGHNLNRGIAS